MFHVNARFHHFQQVSVQTDFLIKYKAKPKSSKWFTDELSIKEEPMKNGPISTFFLSMKIIRITNQGFISMSPELK